MILIQINKEKNTLMGTEVYFILFIFLFFLKKHWDKYQKSILPHLDEK